MQWETNFSYKGKLLSYNRIPHNNMAERAIEIPIVFDFLSGCKTTDRILEVGNVLSYYESEVNKFSRKIIDKYEIGTDVINEDLMEFSERNKYDIIVSISTVEHIGQNWNEYVEQGYKVVPTEKSTPRDLEAPLKAIMKIYSLLDNSGKAIITVPFGKITDGFWYVQFSQDYLEKLITKYQLPKEALEVTYFKRIASETNLENPFQIWLQVDKDELNDVCYNFPYPGGNGLAVIELRK
ncbi:hypothetical protein F7734_37735 [Scytonema sp. UIC 10036]|uniref:hypothetical protein n=1 Tax=Scytonema sp. UIC 10036 TaxID=2304196 RepID=UPI0012DADF85|nr:hypothetical protein [Scytonema sp. UIC 10036]MUG97746.1 hypothetical protein [Scytonema sp. UIC 10036]